MSGLDLGAIQDAIADDEVSRRRAEGLAPAWNELRGVSSAV
jgi:hypothetical protein